MEWLNEEWQQEEDYDNDMHAVEALHHNHHSPHHHHHHGAAVYQSPVALDRRSTAGSSTSNGPAASTSSFRSSYDSYRDVHAAPSSPSHVAYPQSSPSVVSSLNYSSVPGGWSPLYRQPSSTPSQSQVTAASAILRDGGARNDLARRLTLLAQRLTCGDDVDEMALVAQLEQMEKAVTPPSSPNPRRRALPQQQQQQQRTSNPPQSPQSPQSPPSRSETGSVLGSPVSLIRSQFSDLSLASLREQEREREQGRIAEEERQSRQRTGIAEAQAKQLIAETEKLNEELSQVAENLKARQEEMEHINNLLVERAERAAERIVFLQSRVSHLERELDENDDELQHLRICLKAVEIQLPPNPDQELQRCINVFKDDFRQLKRNRAHRATSASLMSSSVTSSQTLTSTPTTPNPGKQRTPSYKLYTTPRNDMK